MSSRLHETGISETLSLKKKLPLFLIFGDWVIGFQSWVLCFMHLIFKYCRSQWLRGLRRGTAAACMLGFWVRALPEAWMPVVMCCWKFLRRANHSSRGVIPSVMCPMSLIVGNQRGDLGPLGDLEPWERYWNIGLSSIEYVYIFHFARFEILTAVLLMFEVFWGCDSVLLGE